MRKIDFIINTSEIGAGTRGASLGPDAMITAARKKGNKLFGNHPIKRVPELNHLLDQDTHHPFAKRIDGLVEIYKSLSSELNSTFKNGNFPLVLASDHASAGGTIAGIKISFPEKKLGVIWIDAHADLHSPFTTPSGNLHGMPLSTALAEDNLECKSNDVSAKTQSLWNELKSIGGITPKISPENIVFIGVRDTEEQEDALITRHYIKNYPVSEVNSLGEIEIARKSLEKLSNCDIIYISFDVDSMDPNITSHGTGTPVNNGLTPQQAQNIMLNLLESPKIVCLEIVEVNPCLDEKTNLMAETAFDILDNLVKKITQ